MNACIYIHLRFGGFIGNIENSCRYIFSIFMNVCTISICSMYVYTVSYYVFGKEVYHVFKLCTYVYEIIFNIEYISP